MAFQNSNRFRTTLSAAITNAQTTIPLTSTAGLPALSAAGPMRFVIAPINALTPFEIIHATGVAGNDLTGVIRGVEGSTAQAWSDLSATRVFSAPTAGVSAANSVAGLAGHVQFRTDAAEAAGSFAGDSEFFWENVLKHIEVGVRVGSAHTAAMYKALVYGALGVFRTSTPKIVVGEGNGVGQYVLLGWDDVSEYGYAVAASNSDGSIIRHLVLQSPGIPGDVNSGKGNVGIGTLSPSEKLHVVGSAVVSGHYATLASSPAQIVADQNDYAPANSSFLRIFSDAARTITGFANTTDGKRLVVCNVGSFAITIAHQSAASLAQNRVITGSAGTNLVLGANDSTQMIYDGASSRWRVINL